MLQAVNLADSLLLVCPEHYSTFVGGESVWDKQRLRRELAARCGVPAADLVNTDDEGGSSFVNTPPKLSGAIAERRRLPKLVAKNSLGHPGLSIGP